MVLRQLNWKQQMSSQVESYSDAFSLIVFSRLDSFICFAVGLPIVCQTCRIRCPASCTLETSAPCMQRDPPVVSSVRWGMSTLTYLGLTPCSVLQTVWKEGSHTCRLLTMFRKCKWWETTSADIKTGIKFEFCACVSEECWFACTTRGRCPNVSHKFGLNVGKETNRCHFEVFPTE